MTMTAENRTGLPIPDPSVPDGVVPGRLQRRT
jgi:hypothetical protein